jgi:hypothetical protein
MRILIQYHKMLWFVSRRGNVDTRFGRHSGDSLCKILGLNFVEWVNDEVRG